MDTVRFLHTADWQLGMRRHFLSEEALPRFMQARIDAIGRMAEIARERACDFVAVCGDVFESNQVDKTTVARALDALRAMPCPVYLLPGNHDPLDAASLYRARDFGDVRVLDSNEPVELRPGVELVGAPWFSKRPGRDLVAEALAPLEPGPTRICLAHGAIEPPAPQIDIEVVRRALAEGRIHFLALGDRHSTTEVDERIWFSGAPEPTDYPEIDPGNALLVELDAEACRVERVPVGRWRFERRAFELETEADVGALAEWLDGHERKDCTVIKLDLDGALTLRDRARLDQLLDDERFAAIERHDDVALRPDELDLTDLGLVGYARDTAEALAERDDETARDALVLLYRLAT
jgi:DNA repair exonuclease SbcCD nuclease subunit